MAVNPITLGSVNRTGVSFLILDAWTKENQAITIGDVCNYDTTGWAPSEAADVAPFGVMVSPTVAAVVATRVAIRMLVRGCVTCQKVTGAALAQGEAATTNATAGGVREGGNYVGSVVRDAASADLIVEILI